jgi:hypothetical protein
MLVGNWSMLGMLAGRITSVLTWWPLPWLVGVIFGQPWRLQRAIRDGLAAGVLVERDSGYDISVDPAATRADEGTVAQGQE